MVFGLSFTEVVFITIAGLFIFGPERLPQVAAKVMRQVRDVQAMVRRARSDLHEAVSPGLSELTEPLRDLESAVADVELEGAGVWRGRRPVPTEPASEEVVEPDER